MKEALGGISIFQLVILFILLFTGIMCLTINQSKAYGVKDEIITIIQNTSLASLNSTNKLSSDTSSKIAEHLKNAGYRITGKCPDEEWIGYDRNGHEVKKDPAYCVRINDVSNSFFDDLEEKCANNKCEVIKEGYPKMVYYDIVLFYQLDIPILNNIMNFKIYGSTKVLFG